MVLDKSGNSIQLPPLPVQIRYFQNNNMIDVEKLTADEGEKRLKELIDLDVYLDACEMCGYLCLLHRREMCVRSNGVDQKEECHVWKLYREKIKPMVVWMKRVVAE